MRLPCFLILLGAVVLTSCAVHEKSALTDKNSPASDGGGQSLAAGIGPHNPCVNLNAATGEELMRLPGIGEAMSRKIIEYREQHGPFRRPEEIIIVEGFSERKYRALAGLVCVR
ncbi:MAG TPA: helix-hairpin-helix domain-containing protein [Blastocatellia bacterium]|jgi:competence protein ComEA